MEAWNSVDPASPDEIVVRMSKWAWGEVLTDLYYAKSYEPLELASGDLLNELERLGVR